MPYMLCCWHRALSIVFLTVQKTNSTDCAFSLCVHYWMLMFEVINFMFMVFSISVCFFGIVNDILHHQYVLCQTVLSPFCISFIHCLAKCSYRLPNSCLYLRLLWLSSLSEPTVGFLRGSSCLPCLSNFCYYNNSVWCVKLTWPTLLCLFWDMCCPFIKECHMIGEIYLPFFIIFLLGKVFLSFLLSSPSVGLKHYDLSSRDYEYA